MKKSREKLQKELEKLKKEQQQMEHRMQLLKNRKNYVTNQKRRERSHRLITKGAAIESILPKVKELSELEFYSLMEMLFHEKQLYAQTETFIAAIISKRGGE